MKKIIYYICFSVIILILPFVADAASVSVGFNCPSSAASGDEISCNVTINSNVKINGLAANYSITGADYVSFTPSSGFKENYISKTGFNIGNISGKSGNYTIGVLKVKVKSAATIILSKIDIGDVDYNSYTSSDKKVSIRIKSSNNYLKSLSINEGSLSPSFSKNTTSYKATINGTSVYINASAEDSNATVSGTGRKTLNYGVNTFKVNVKSEAGTTKTYTLTITRPDNRNTNNNLKSLSTSVGSISFNKNTTSYSLKVAPDVKSADITAAVEDSKASFVSGYGSRSVNLKYGKNAIQVKVKAENEKVKTYTINIEREDNRNSNNYLTSLTLSHGKITFNKNTLNYNVTVPMDVSRIEINAVAEDSKAKVNLNNVDLVYGDNVITIDVISESEAVRTYTLNVKRLSEAEKMSDNNNITSIDIFGHEFKLLEDVFSYDLIIGSNEKDLLFNILMEDERANYIIENNENLKSGSVVTIKAISESGLEQVYKIKIKKEAAAAVASESNLGLYLVACFISLLIGFAMGFLTPKVLGKLNTSSANGAPNISVNSNVIKEIPKNEESVNNDEKNS